MSDETSPARREAEKLQDSLAKTEGLIEEFSMEIERRVIERIEPKLFAVDAKLNDMSRRLRIILFCSLAALGLSLAAIVLAVLC